MDKVSIALLDPHILFRKSLIQLIHQFDDYQVTIDAGSEGELLDKIMVSGPPQIVLIAIMLPGKSGYHTTRLLKQLYPSVKSIALSAISTDFAVMQMVESGACGFVTKAAAPQKLKTILDIVCHPAFDCSGIEGLFVQKMLPPEFKHSRHSLSVHLSEIEIIFLQLCCTERTYSQIANNLSINEKAVDKMREKLFEKLVLKSRSQLVVFAITNGLLVDLVPIAC